MNVHILNNDKFSNGEINVFETYYPGENLYLIYSKNGNFEFIPKFSYVYIIDSISDKTIDKIYELSNGVVDNVLVYFLDSIKAKIALQLKQRFNSKIYWMFYGADLYTHLNRIYNYQLYDYPIPKNRNGFLRNSYYLMRRIFNLDYKYLNVFLSQCDFFCFWNIYDYKLLINHFNTNISFKFFTHGVGRKFDVNNLIEKNKYQIQINNSASVSGNHLTLIKKIQCIDLEKKFKLVIPLSYGNKYIIDMVNTYLHRNNINSEVIRDFIPIDDYSNLITKSSVAIFGARRQEAGFNIFEHLLSGSKIFLRNDNNMTKLIRDWGGVVFSFEDDLNTIEDLLTPLSRDQIQRNKEIIINHISEDAVKTQMINFFGDNDNIVQNE